MASGDLLWAFRNCAMPIGDPIVDRDRQLGMVRLYQRLQQLAPRVDATEDAASNVCLRFAAAGPRAPKPDDPDSDETVDRYLLRALKNEKYSGYRAQKGTASLAKAPPVRDRIIERLIQDEESEERRKLMGQAMDRLFAEVLPTAAARVAKPHRQAFDKAICQRREIARGELTCNELLLRDEGVLDKKARARFDQQQCRALKRLAAVVEDLALGLPSGEAQALRGVFRALKDMELQWPLPAEVDPS